MYLHNIILALNNAMIGGLSIISEPISNFLDQI
jgi:hypothetical protein